MGMKNILINKLSDEIGIVKGKIQDIVKDIGDGSNLSEEMMRNRDELNTILNGLIDIHKDTEKLPEEKICDEFNVIADDDKTAFCVTYFDPDKDNEIGFFSSHSKKEDALNVLRDKIESFTKSDT